MDRRRIMAALLLATFAHLGWAADSGPDLRIETEFPADDTGTMHYAKRVKFSAENAVLKIETDVEAGCLAPIVVRHLQVAKDTWLIIGWTSSGGGMETYYAWLLRTHGKQIKIEDRLDYTCERAQLGLLLRQQDDEWQVGIVAPPVNPGHADEWKLGTKSGTQDMAYISKLAYIPVAVNDKMFIRTHYFQQPNESAQRVAWFNAGYHGFKPLK